MKNCLVIFALVLLLLSIYSCSSEQNAFKEATGANTIEALKKFATNYPNSELIDSARGIIDNMVWQSVLSLDSLKRYQKFIAEYPGNKFVDSAKVIVDNAMWQSLRSSEDYTDYESFVEEYPESHFIDSAKIMIDKLKPKDLD